MSEHVLCMVLYLIELGLDNQVQEDKVEEVSVFSVISGVVISSHTTHANLNLCLPLPTITVRVFYTVMYRITKYQHMLTWECVSFRGELLLVCFLFW